MRTTLFIACLTATLTVGAGQHLFILSGQSNMKGLKPEESFIPTVEQALGKANVIVVKDAKGGEPIRRWYKEWQSAAGVKPAKNGDLYDRLMKKVTPAIADKKLASVTFVWMQGEYDAKTEHGEVYGKSFLGLIKQIETDLGRSDVNFVIGRLSDFDMANTRRPHWTMIRDVQVRIAEGHPRGSWVNTDDLNDGQSRKGKEIKDDLHYTKDGYVTLGKRFADKAIVLVKKARDR